MKPPGVVRSRRAFLAPIWVAAVAALIAATVLFVGVRFAVSRIAEISTIIVLRDAETLAGQSGDPSLSPEGEARALRLAAMFGGPSDAGAIHAIYAGDTQRARQTAAPLAARLALPVVAIAGGDVPGLLRRLRDDARGRTSLVVERSDNVPRIVAALTDGRATVSLDDSDFGSIFIVTVSTFGPPSVVRLRY